MKLNSILKRTLEKITAKASKTPANGVKVGLYGFMFSESSEFQMDDTSDIHKVAAEVRRRYGCRAYGFRRCYYLHGRQDFVDKGWVFLGGTVRTANEVMIANDPSEHTLRINIKCNDMKAVIYLASGQVFVFNPDKDILLDDTRSKGN